MKPFNTFYLLIFISFIGFAQEKNLLSHSNTILADTTEMKKFIGYFKLYPVFASRSRLLILNNDTLKFLKSYNNNYEPLFINDDGIVYKVSNSNKIIIEKTDNSVISLDLIYSPSDNILVSRTLDTIIFTDNLQSNIIIVNTIKKNVKNTGIKGYVIALIGNKLFFARDINPPDDPASAIATLYESNIDNLKGTLLMRGILDQSISILPDAEWVICKVPYNGDYMPAIYSIKKRKFRILKNISDGSSYYSFQEKKIIFYNVFNLNKEKIDLEEGDYNYLPSK